MVARAGHDVQAVVHAIDQVDIGMTGRAEHDLGARSAAACRVGSEVARAQIRLGLDDPPDLAAAINAANDELAQEVPSHTLGVTIVKGFWEDLHENHRTRRGMVWLLIGVVECGSSPFLLPGSGRVTPNTVELAVTYCRGGDCEFVPPFVRGEYCSARILPSGAFRRNLKKLSKSMIIPL